MSSNEAMSNKETNENGTTVPKIITNTFSHIEDVLKVLRHKLSNSKIDEIVKCMVVTPGYWSDGNLIVLKSKDTDEYFISAPESYELFDSVEENKKDNTFNMYTYFVSYVYYTEDYKSYFGNHVFVRDTKIESRDDIRHIELDIHNYITGTNPISDIMQVIINDFKLLKTEKFTLCD